jgi:hypothetical protein
VHVNVRSVGVGRVRVCMLCTCVSEYHRDDGEGVVLEELTRLSYTRRFISLSVDSQRMGDVPRTNGTVYMCDRVG